jgi:2-keto-4-pentenoate hydratase
VTGLDERVAAGMRGQLAKRRERLDTGERPLGWKVGYGAPAAAAQLGIDRPLVGFLTDRSVLPDGATVEIGGWGNPRLEPEIAVHMGADVGPGASRDEAGAAISGLSAAIELVDVYPPTTDVQEILAGNIFHRHVILGPSDETRRDGEGIGGRVLLGGEQIASTDNPAALTGELLEVVRLTAELLEACGERLRAGEVIITGSVLPPIDLAPGQDLTAELGPLGALSVTVR